MSELHAAMALAIIPGQPNYGVSKDGKIWSFKSNRVIIGTTCGKMGYRAIQFPDGTRRYTHRIVCEAFHGPRPTIEMQVRHLDGNRNNNAASNLAWGTKAENEADKFQHGTTPKGEANPQAKLTRAAVDKMKVVRASTGRSFAKIAAQFGVSTMTAHRAITGVSWND